MTAVVFYFQVHQPYRLNPYKPADVGTDKPYFDDDVNRQIVRRVAERCYLPMNAVIKEQIEKTDGRFRCSFSLSGTVVQQMRDWAPKALQSFVDLAKTGAVEFLCETSHHSLAVDADPDEFTEQVTNHRRVIEDLFGSRPTTFRNTELWIDENVAKRVEDLGFDVLLGEGADRLLGWRSPQLVYRPRGCERLKLLLRSYLFSDDIAFRFSNKEWPHHPLMADTFASWLHAVPRQAQFLGLFMDYETFGEHQWVDTGILEFMKYLPGYILENERFSFQTPAEFAAATEPVAHLDIPDAVSWADEERSLAAWLGNEEQQEAHRALYALSADVRKAAAAGRTELLEDWRKLTTSDHVYYMCKKAESDGEVHEYFSPYEGPHEAFLRFTSVVDDLKSRLAGRRKKRAARKRAGKKRAAKQPAATKPAATKPAATKPAATKPAATKPAATKPAATKPAATKPASTRSAAKSPTNKPASKKSTGKKTSVKKAARKRQARNQTVRKQRAARQARPRSPDSRE
jgi:alpha-amylase